MRVPAASSSRVTFNRAVSMIVIDQQLNEVIRWNPIGPHKMWRSSRSDNDHDLAPL